MNWALPPDEHTLPEESGEWIKNPSIPGLPMDGWPSCFWAARKSLDGKYYEVMLNESAWDEAGKIWKFYPPTPHSNISKRAEVVKNSPPFLWNEALCDSLDDVVSYSTTMWIIEDGIVNATDRRTLFQEHNDVSLYCKNISKLRKNRMSDISNALSYINARLSQRVDTPLNNLGVDLRSKYDALSYSDKVAFVQKLDRDVGEYLNKLYQQLTASSTLQ